MIIEKRLTKEQTDIMELVSQANILQNRIMESSDGIQLFIENNSGGYRNILLKLKSINRDILEGLSLLNYALIIIKERKIDITPLGLSEEDLTRSAVKLFTSIGRIAFFVKKSYKEKRDKELK